MSFAYDYPRPALTVDCVVFGLDENSLKVLLIQRKIEPFLGQWALPGGFVRMDENLETAARRELRELATPNRGGVRGSEPERAPSTPRATTSFYRTGSTRHRHPF